MMVAAAIFIGLWLAGEWPALRAHAWQLQGGWLVLSAFLMLASWGVEIALWQSIIATLGGRMGYLPGARIWFKSAVVRYVPGNIWQPLSMTLQAQQQGVRAEVTVTSVVLYQGIILMAAAPIAAIYFWLTGNWGLLTAAVAGRSIPGLARPAVSHAELAAGALWSSWCGVRRWPQTAGVDAGRGRVRLAAVGQHLCRTDLWRFGVCRRANGGPGPSLDCGICNCLLCGFSQFHHPQRLWCA
jgi:hypothetical protein